MDPYTRGCGRKGDYREIECAERIPVVKVAVDYSTTANADAIDSSPIRAR
jgi:hypothetical protein